MEAIMRRLPTAEGIGRNRGKIAGFAFGVLAPLLLAGVLVTAYTGHSLFITPPPPTPIYPNW